MTRVKQHPRQMGGIACQPAPRSSIEALGLWLIGLAAAVIPIWAWQWAAARWPWLEFQEGPGEEA